MNWLVFHFVSFLALLAVPRGQGRGGRVEERPVHSWNSSFGGPISQHQTNGHFRDGSREISSHAVRQELLHSRLRGAIRPAARRRMRHDAAAGRRAQRGRSIEGAIAEETREPRLD